MDVADRYRLFAWEVRGVSSLLYERLTVAVADDDEILRLIGSLPQSKQQPNLFFASVNFLGGISGNYDEFRTFVLDRESEVVELMRSRRTQTNEIGRCATLLPALARLPEPLALIEVGASAGLNLMLDRFAYSYGGDWVGDPSSPVRLTCENRGEVPVPEQVPKVAWRRGIDLAPIDVFDDESVRWLKSCVFADNVERAERLEAAIELARKDPPVVEKGDLVDRIEDVVGMAPGGATVVVFHSAVLNYLPTERRARFAEIVGGLDVVWLSNEGIGVVPGVINPDGRVPREVSFALAQGTVLLAFTQAHGRWIEWVGST